MRITNQKVSPMTPQQRHHQIDAAREHRAIENSHDLRQIGARQEFAKWREANPNFSSRELLEEWARIRRAWGLGTPPKPARRKTP